MQESLQLLRGGSVVSSLLGAFGHGLRETRLTAALGYMVALWSEGFQEFFAIKGDIQSVSVEHNHDNDRSDIYMETSLGDVVIEAKVTTANPKAQARKYPAAQRIILSQYLPSMSERGLKKYRYVSWRDVAAFIENQCLKRSPELKVVGQNMLAYMEEHYMIKTKDQVEIYAREINTENTLQLFLHGRIYACDYKANSRLPEALYFAPHFGRSIASLHPGVQEGISYIAEIENIEIVESWDDVKRAIIHQRGRSWHSKNMHLLNGNLWLKRRKKRSLLFLDEPQLVFNPPVRKENLQSGSGWLSKHFFSFNTLFKGWKKKQKEAAKKQKPSKKKRK